jgi:hypothetical protein
MAGNKYMTLDGGKKALIKSNNTSVGAADSGKIVSLNAAGKIDPSLLTDQDVSNIEAFENLAAGDYVNLFLDASVIKARLADNSNDRPAHGYIDDTVTAASNVNVFFEGSNTNLSGLTVGARQFLGTIGQTIETALDPTNAANDGDLHQLLGVAISATEINTDIQDCILL